ncbi:MAG: hypothetical protein N3A38_10055 [Planctomycetota bacterium]|nr:hypothetical protein [Planctomycetota bacterium]
MDMWTNPFGTVNFKSEKEMIEYFTSLRDPAGKTRGLDFCIGATRVCYEPLALVKTSIKGAGILAWRGERMSSGDLCMSPEEILSDSQLYAYAASLLDAGESRVMAGLKVGGTVLASGNPVTGVPLCVYTIGKGAAEDDWEAAGAGTVGLVMHVVAAAGSLKAYPIRQQIGVPTFARGWNFIRTAGIVEFARYEMSMPTFEYVLCRILDRRHTTISAHGCLDFSRPRFQIRSDQELVVYCPEGEPISAELAACIERGEFWRVPYRRVIAPGERRLDVELQPLKPGEAIPESGIQPRGKVYLSQMLEELPPGRIHLSACLYDELYPYPELHPAGPLHPFSTVPLPQAPLSLRERR